ncbi:hypothetical protein [Mycobacterium sp. URHB0021]|jgi:hypothetical protein
MPDPSPSESSLRPRPRGASRRAGPLPVVAIIIAVVALALAGWSLFLSLHDRASQVHYTDAQQADAKVKACSAIDLVRRGISLNTNLQPAGGPADVTGSQAVAANARVALYDGGQYLLARLDTATPTDLADAIRKFADTAMDIGAAATAGAQNSDPAQAARLQDADSANATITELCK